ncbi:AAA family ATPase [Streptomyces sp. NPDC002812]|uniref:AAA family ATPase n=1 Tax=Streptomyces sp. NPDC002812 TaxID=3154434 RepID=UPI00331DB987
MEMPERGRSLGCFVTFEGYDGAGKSSLISSVREILKHKSIRVVGRKTEPELVDISRVLEREDLRHHGNVEVLLRIALEIEREGIVDRSRLNNDITFCDRGVISLISWFDYLGVPREPCERLLNGLMDYHSNALTVVCAADFDTCWKRISSRSEQSRKEKLGKDVNSEYFAMYEANVLRYAETAAEVVFVDTVGLDLAESTSQVVQALQSRGLIPS